MKNLYKFAFLGLIIPILLGFNSCRTSKVPKNPCYPDISMGGINYSISPCSIIDTLIDGKGDKVFSVTIKPSLAIASYGFTVFGYGEGFPVYSIMANPSSGGAEGNQKIYFAFKDKVLNKGTYEGYIPIHLFRGSDTENDSNFVKIKIKLTVK